MKKKSIILLNEMNENKFIVILRDLKLQNSVIEKNDVGIIINSKDIRSEVYLLRIGKNIDILNSDFKIFDVTKAGDSYPQKICDRCYKLLDTSLFQRNQNGVNNRPVRRPSCNDCRRVIDGKQISNSEKYKWMRVKPDKELFECPVCKKKILAGITTKVVLDHNHDSGEVRGWICDSCNTGLGRFKDNIETLKEAIIYLEKNN